MTGIEMATGLAVGTSDFIEVFLEVPSSNFKLDFLNILMILRMKSRTSRRLVNFLEPALLLFEVRVFRYEVWT